MLKFRKKNKDNTPVVLEKEVSFSESAVWEYQKQYYAEKGIDAWKEVPFYATSNPMIATQYATIVINFMQDWCHQNASADQSIFYIMELGAGTGQFSFYFLKTLCELQKKLDLSHLSFRYIMSDAAPNLLDFWLGHDKLHPFIQAGILDFAIYDLNTPGAIHLSIANKTIKPNEIINPLTLIANYIFDSLPSDIFYVKNGELYESLMTLHTTKKDMPRNEDGITKNIQVAQKKQLFIPGKYSAALEKILSTYREKLNEGYFYFPINTLNALATFQSLSKNGFLLLSSDNGNITLEELEGKKEPSFNIEGTYYTEVNYHAIDLYLKNTSKSSMLFTNSTYFTTTVFSSGFLLENCPKTRTAIEQEIQSFSPANYLSMCNDLSKDIKKYPYEVLLSFLQLSRWDPRLFDQCYLYLSQSFSNSDYQSRDFLLKHIYRIDDNFYYTPSMKNSLFSMGVFYQNINLFDQAITYYEKSLRYSKPTDEFHINMGVCLYMTKKYTEAIGHFQKALSLNDKAKLPTEWIEKSRKKLVTIH